MMRQMFRFQRDRLSQPVLLPVGFNEHILNTPVGNAVGSSSFEMVPPARARAASDRGLDDSVETVPIIRANSSPSIIQVPTQVMSPNLVAGSASNTNPVGSSTDTDAGVQAILQQWQEVKTEHGTVERTYTQCAQTGEAGIIDRSEVRYRNGASGYFRADDNTTAASD